MFIALGVLSPACNEVIGIEEPTDITISDGSALSDVGQGAGRGAGGNQPSSREGGDADALANSDAGTNADVIANSDTFARSDGPFAADALGSDGRGGTVTDGGGAIADAGDAGILVAAGAARGTGVFSDLKGANPDSSPFSSTQGSAGRKLAGVDEVAEISLTSFHAGVQRNLNVRIQGSVAPGKVIALDAASTVAYYDVATGRGWTSASVTPQSGTLRINDVVGTSYSFTIVAAKLGPVLAGEGTFTMNGSGRANPQ